MAELSVGDGGGLERGQFVSGVLGFILYRVYI